ncbi:helix-hairpin-helix domain-containing protein [Streptomyces griseoviridis]|uniref:helix-hairpin-helix domain-containing protein n=1 Tax=Streptomyces griseoviridis TaxID=45398 RepID=UPI003F56E2B1
MSTEPETPDPTKTPTVTEPGTTGTPGGGGDTGGASEGGSAGGSGAEGDGDAGGGDDTAVEGAGASAGGAAVEGAVAGGEGSEGEGEGAPAESDPPEGAVAESDPPEGAVAEGDAAEGAVAEGDAAEGDGSAKQLSEAEAELAAQRVERERIARRKAEKQAAIDSGAKLSGKAADLLAAVRAVESGRQPSATVFADPEPAPRPAVPAPVRPARPEQAAVAAPAPAAVDSVRQVLGEGGAPDTLAPQVAAALGEDAARRLREDPWLLLRVGGVRPEQADGFARALLGAACAPDDERRGRSFTGWLLEQAAVAGHTVLEMPALIAALGRQAVPDPEAAVQSAVAEAEALVFEDALDPTAPVPEPRAQPSGAGDAEHTDDAEDEPVERPVRVLVGLERYALAEESLAEGVARLINSVPKEDGSAEWERAADSARGSAAELLRAVRTGGLVLHTGGEASSVEAATLLRTATGAGLRAWAATHGADGRDRFAAVLDASGGTEDGTIGGRGAGGSGAEGPGADGAERPGADGAEGSRAGGLAPVATLAGLLSGAEGPGRDAEGALDLDLLVVLDAPQLDVEEAALLVESLPDGARLVLAGDPGVLWSAGPGRVFADLLAARVCPQIASRVPDPGPLGELVSGIGVGELNQVEAPGKEVVIVPVRDAGEAVHRAVQLVADSVPRAIGVPAEQTQVITPGHGGAVGTRVLNAALKERLNPGPGRFGGFDPGDRVAYSPAPGRTLTGQVVRADAEGLHLRCAGAAVVVPKERVEQAVRHGWAVTAHQAAGARWPAVVVVLPGDAAQALSRPWVYTAFGRAERHLSVVHGVEQALARAVAEVQAKPRTTRLPALLAPQLPTTTG